MSEQTTTGVPRHVKNPEDAVADEVLDTDEERLMYSTTESTEGRRRMDYGTESAGGEHNETIWETLESYRVLV